MRHTLGLRVPLMVLGGGAILVLSAALAQAQPASALLREDDELLPGETISSLSNTAVNHVGGYACSLNTEGTATISRIWGNPMGGVGTLLRSEMTIGVFEQTSFESFYGMSDTGQLAYGTTSTNTDTGETGLDGVWLDDLAILHEDEPVPGMPGQFSTFNSRPLISGDGAPQWVGGITDTQGGSTQIRVLFRGVGVTPLIMGGDSVPGVPEPVGPGGAIDFDHRLSRFGSSWIDQVLLATSTAEDGLMVINGAAVSVGGGLMREASPVPASVGGLVDENWDNFDFLGISEAGDFLVTGDTDADTAMDEFVFLTDQIVLREGTVLMLDGGLVTVAGSIEGGYMNEQADWAVIWDVDLPTGENLEALIFNGEILLVEGDSVDWNGDGVIDAGDDNGKIANFTGISALTVGARVGGVVNIYFTADIDFFDTPSSTDDLEGFFCLPVNVGFGPVAALDIKPGSCPNSFNRSSNGVLPMALVGTDVFDVFDVDFDTLLLQRADGMGGAVAPLNGPPGPGFSYEDTTAPFDGELCDCAELMGDGITDLSLKFRTSDVVDLLGLDLLPGGEEVGLCLSGLLADGTPFEACDCIRLVPPNAVGEVALVVTSNADDVFIDVSPLDEFLDGGGFGSFKRFFPAGTPVTLSAPMLYHGQHFKGWMIAGPRQFAVPMITSPVIVVHVNGDGLATAVYQDLASVEASSASVE